MKKTALLFLAFVMIISMTACGGVKYPSDKQVLEDLQKDEYLLFYISETNQQICINEQAAAMNIETIYKAISFKSTEDPKTKDGTAFIWGELTLETAGTINIRVFYNLFDDNTTKYISAIIE